MYYTEKGL